MSDEILPLPRSIIPVHDKVVFRRIAEREQKTKAGLFVPDVSKDKPIEGEVIAIGPGATLDNGAIRKMASKPGDRILVGKFSGFDFKVDGWFEELTIIRDDEVLAILGPPTYTSNTRDDDALPFPVPEPAGAPQ
jgi:chaperonin GroES